MGQYYYIVNVTKKEYLKPHDFGDGAKLLEFGASGGGVMLGLAVLLASGNGQGGGDLHTEDIKIPGRWAGDTVIVAGDYAPARLYLSEEEVETWFDERGVIEGENPEDDEGPNLYQFASHYYHNLSYEVMYVLCEDTYCRDELRDRLSWRLKDKDIPARLLRRLTAGDKKGVD